MYHYKNSVKSYFKRGKIPTHKRGRSRKLNERNVQNLIRCLKSLREREGTFASKRLAKEAGIDYRNVCMRTIRRAINKEGFKYLQARKKGILKKN
jgi:transposase